MGGNSKYENAFESDKQEIFYYKLLAKGLDLMVDKLSFFIKHQDIPSTIRLDASFFKHIRKIQKYIKVMDLQKSSEPKFSS